MGVEWVWGHREGREASRVNPRFPALVGEYWAINQDVCVCVCECVCVCVSRGGVSQVL